MQTIDYGYIHRENVMAFDMDGTLVTTASKKKLPEDEMDYVLTDLAIRLSREGNPIVVFTNQRWKGEEKRDMHIRRVNRVMESMRIPIIAYIAFDHIYGKPRVKMLESFVYNYPNIDTFTFVGDAAGRPGDHSDSDYAFLYNARLYFVGQNMEVESNFLTPEEYMDLSSERKRLIGFDPKSYIKEVKKSGLAKNNRAAMVDMVRNMIDNPKTIIITVGPPGCGKNTFAERMYALYCKICEGKGDMYIVNRKTVAQTRKELEEISEGPIIVISKQSNKLEVRKDYFSTKKGWKKIVVYWDDIEVATHLNNMRSAMTNKPPLSKLSYNAYYKNYDMPTTREADEIIHWKFDCSFTYDTEVMYYMMRY